MNVFDFFITSINYLMNSSTYNKDKRTEVRTLEFRANKNMLLRPLNAKKESIHINVGGLCSTEGF